MTNKIIYQPLKPFFINQGFGENRSCVDLATTSKVITCDGSNPPSGFRSLYGEKGHLGIDLMASRAQEVYCAQGGTVYEIDTNPKSGLDVRIISKMNGNTYRHIYEHLLGYQPSIDAKIRTGQLIGWADNTGWSSGNHLHFQLEKLINGIWVPIDPLPLMAPIFAKDILYMVDKLQYIKEQVAIIADRLANRLRVR